MKDTAAQVRLVPRQPTMVEFIPIGHVAVDIHEPEEDMKLGLPATGTVWIHQLYVSRKVSNAMSCIVPRCIEILTLCT